MATENGNENENGNRDRNERDRFFFNLGKDMDRLGLNANNVVNVIGDGLFVPDTNAEKVWGSTVQVAQKDAPAPDSDMTASMPIGADEFKALGRFKLNKYLRSSVNARDLTPVERTKIRNVFLKTLNKDGMMVIQANMHISMENALGRKVPLKLMYGMRQTYRNVMHKLGISQAESRTQSMYGKGVKFINLRVVDKDGKIRKFIQERHEAGYGNRDTADRIKELFGKDVSNEQVTNYIYNWEHSRSKVKGKVPVTPVFDSMPKTKTKTNNLRKIDKDGRIRSFIAQRSDAGDTPKDIALKIKEVFGKDVSSSQVGNCRYNYNKFYRKGKKWKAGTNPVSDSVSKSKTQVFQGNATREVKRVEA